MDLFMLSGYLLNKGQGNRETFKGYWEPSKFGAGLFCSGIMMKKQLDCSVKISVAFVQLYSMSLVDWQLETTHVFFGPRYL